MRQAAMARLRPLLGRWRRRTLDPLRRQLHRLRVWGPRAVLRLPAWQRQMEAAALVLPPPATEHGEPLEVWFLTGRRFWYQTAFCAWSLACASQRPLVLQLVDDGTLTPADEAALRRLFPQGATRWRRDLQPLVEDLLPLHRFPTLRARWDDYINIHKLIAVHLGQPPALRLVLDSDMLLLGPPHELLAWWDAMAAAPAAAQRHRPCLMVDCEESYGYSRPLMEALCGAPIPPLLNVGVCGLHSDLLDWEELEHWCRTLWEREGSCYFLEQALVAMLAAREQPLVLPPERYITAPGRRQVRRGEGVLHHFVADSKPLYFGPSWRRQLQELRP